MSSTTVATADKPRIITIDDNPAIHDDFYKILATSDDNDQLHDSVSAFFGDSELTSGKESSLQVELDSACKARMDTTK